MTGIEWKVRYLFMLLSGWNGQGNATPELTGWQLSMAHREKVAGVGTTLWLVSLICSWPKNTPEWSGSGL